MSQITQIKEMMKYRVGSKTEFDLHSPFLFDFVSNVVYEKGQYYDYVRIEKVRDHLLEDSNIIEIEDYGAGSKIFNSNKRRVKDIAKHSVKQKKYGQLLFRIVNFLQPENSIELGTSLGITTAYLCRGKSKGKVYSIEGDPATHRLAKRTLRILGIKNGKLIQSKFTDALDELLPKLDQVDFVFIDGHHSKEPTLEYFHKCLAKSHNNTVFIFDDINWSKEMKEAWDEVKKHEQVTATLDFFQMGIVFLRKELSKEHFTIRY